MSNYGNLDTKNIRNLCVILPDKIRCFFTVASEDSGKLNIKLNIIFQHLQQTIYRKNDNITMEQIRSREASLSNQNC